MAQALTGRMTKKLPEQLVEDGRVHDVEAKIGHSVDLPMIYGVTCPRQRALLQSRHSMILGHPAELILCTFWSLDSLSSNSLWSACSATSGLSTQRFLMNVAKIGI